MPILVCAAYDHNVIDRLLKCCPIPFEVYILGFRNGVGKLCWIPSNLRVCAPIVAGSYNDLILLGIDRRREQERVVQRNSAYRARLKSRLLAHSVRLNPG